MGQKDCIIFRPEGINIEAGDVYKITISETQTFTNGVTRDVLVAQYTVRFF